MSEGVILVIDDEPGITRLCQRLLEKAGFEVLTFGNPRDGLAALQQADAADLLLVDIRMPDMDGFQVIDIARQQQPELAVVVMTGFGTVETAIEALRRGADGLTLKPFSGRELVESVKRALEQNQSKRDMLRLKALRPLFDVNEKFFSERDPDRLREILLQAVCGQLHCALSEFYQPSQINTPGGSDFIVHQFECNPSSPDRFDHKGIEDICLQIVSQTRSTDSLLSIQSSHLEEGELRSAFRTSGVGSILCAPVTMRQGAEVKGFLLALRWENGLPFRQSDFEMFSILARQAAVALENARLHTELRNKIIQLEESQRALVQSEKMALVGRLTASIAHEINNPLQAMQNCLDLARRDELPPPQRENYLNLAGSELDRLMTTVQRMLEFYRPVSVDRKAADINDIIRRVLILVDKQMQDHKILLNLHLASRIPKTFVVVNQIQQVFLNLILNAIQAMQDGGELMIQTGVRQTGTRKSNQMHKEVEILFLDTGPGIPSEARKHIFEPFVSSKEEGTGLGLAVSYGIITAHGGTLEFIDEENRKSIFLRSSNPSVGSGGLGACFRVSLPIEDLP